jgi:hypothetical protein
MSMFMDIYLVGTELFNVGGETDGQTAGITKLIILFYNFVNAPKLSHFLLYVPVTCNYSFIYSYLLRVSVRSYLKLNMSHLVV